MNKVILAFLIFSSISRVRVAESLNLWFCGYSVMGFHERNHYSGGHEFEEQTISI